jgi:hypothetical protein
VVGVLDRMHVDRLNIRFFLAFLDSFSDFFHGWSLDGFPGWKASRCVDILGLGVDSGSGRLL